MNKRIKELAEQAKLYEPSDCSMLTKEQWLETFAELLIDECCGVLLDMHAEANGIHNYYSYAVSEIQDRFNKENT